MRLKSAPGAGASLWSSILALLTLLAVITDAKNKDKPDIAVAKFDQAPLNFAFFKGSDVVMFQENDLRSVWRSDDGGATWEQPEDIEEGGAFLLILHPHDNDRAYVLSPDNTHWKTEDKGKSWSKFYTDVYTHNRRTSDWMVFHADDPDKIIFNGLQFDGLMYHEAATYTKDNFKHDALPLISHTQGCWWARSTKLFTTSEEDADAHRILCIVTQEDITADPTNNRVVISDSYFSVDEAERTIDAFEPDMNDGETTRGAVTLLVVKSFLLVAAVSKNTDEMAVYVTDDTMRWHRAVFPAEHRLDTNMYTVLESTNYSIQVDVRVDGRVNMGTLFTSNSNGTYFTKTSEHTNRDFLDRVDFEQVSSIQGVFLINQVENYDEAKSDDQKVRKSKITFDDGRNFEAIKMQGDDGDEVHLHSVTEYRNIGAVFSSPAPGLIMGNGNTGDYLKDYGDSRLYISDDAGRTWVKGPKGPHLYEFGDQGSVLIAIQDSEEMNVGEFKYSLNHGEDWTNVKLPDGLEILPMQLTTTQDAASLKFILTGMAKEDGARRYQVISIDFAGLQERTCTGDDMEDWPARADESGDATCIMGHTQVYTRRKKGSDCFIKKEYDLPMPKTESCDCKDEDFECDFNFVRVGDECELAPTASLVPPSGACRGDDPDETFKGPSGWRRIPGNKCKSSGKSREDEKKWACSDAKHPPSSPGDGNITHTSYSFDGEANIIELHYLERSERNGDDDTVLARTGFEVNGKAGYSGRVYITRDQGKNWELIEAFEDDDILYITTHPLIKDMVFFVSSKKVWYTMNRGVTFDYFKPPDEIDWNISSPPVALNPTQKDSVIWLGQKDGINYAEASLSTDRGDNWSTIRRHVSKCEFTSSSSINFRNKTQVVCVAREDEDESKPWQLIYSDDPENPDLGFQAVVDDVDNFAQMAEFIVVSKKNVSDNHDDDDDDKRRSTDQGRAALVSLNGRDYAEAKFPINYDIHGFTVLDSATHAVNLFAKIEDTPGRAYGAILKSNSNGTTYVQSLANVNCNDKSYADFEKMAGLEGVVLVNTVLNPGADESKKLQTRISHNDGAGWAFLPPPSKDVDGAKYDCSSTGNENCALHLHGLSERRDASNAYSSESAIGLMCGIGNVGTYLSSSDEADTFMTTDGGLSWKNVMKGSHRWSFGDHGAIIVLAPRNSKTNKVYYSLDAGDKWDEAVISDKDIDIIDVTTLRSGASRSFIVWGRDGDKVMSINLDFSGLTTRQCEVLDDPDESDYEVFSPGHPLSGNGCLFGHKKRFLRKKKDRTDCYNGNEPLSLPGQNCECTRQDYECDYNFEMNSDGSCGLVPGLEPISIDEWCEKNPDEDTFYAPSGMRRIPLTTCQGGTEYDKVNQPMACPGHEEEFEKKHRASGVGIFFAVVISLGIAAGAGWWMWNHYHSNFGQIRLGEQSGLDNDSPWIRYPVIVVSAAVAVAGALPLLASSLWRTIRSQVGGGSRGDYSWLRGGNQRRFTTRDSFARGRGDYSIVDEDEGALLGDDSDEDM